MTDVQQSLMGSDDLPIVPEPRVEWDAVRKAAVVAFDLWNNSGELAWAERAWRHHTRAWLPTEMKGSDQNHAVHPACIAPEDTAKIGTMLRKCPLTA